ncbi:anion permease [Streptomyces sp. ID01-12c]|uniref:Anion permease n=1 Tax=Streptomyces caniscabiei TaxID=2746961 RepID=A0A927LES1_9ACTN|nr:SLC13 family permease [Streptomyces caniscabiei]MBD9703814.1 anion permease [Streptomyces caniscabiei]MBD9729771.1 anion permease [Streptomyces caniscabiei]MDX3509964.1 SLC13 family permease [Streptomyces caniscabiei]MDX3724703.1 SLC13 family permease [Streptomyces caniscabiei]MDX3729204.1 SLC13 family permease [Streptomyces caniscabiei]
MTLNLRLATTLCAALSLCALLAVPGNFPGLGGDARLTLAVFALATAAWIGTPIDDTYIALGAGLALTVTGVISDDTLFRTLGDDTVWLLICAFVLAAAVTRTGLAGRAAAFLVSGARTVRQLTHLTTAALVVTAFAVPATSGRAALALPVFLALAKALADRRRLVVMLALLFPTVILLSAVATLIGAGAHLITVSVLWEATGDRIGFTEWLLLGLPLAIVSSHLAAEAVLLTTTRREDRHGPVRITAEEIQRHSEQPVTGPWSPAESRCALLLATVVVLWCSEPLHRVSPAVVALIGAVVASSPALGTVRLKDALRTVPWSMLLFMAATMAMGVALSDSGAAKWLVSGLPPGLAPPLFLVVVVVLSTAAHLVLQSRSARSSVLVPLVVAAAVGAGVNPVAAALASTAAAGFCHTLPASAKPVALFADLPGTPTYTPRDLLRLSAVLAPLTAALVVLFAVAVWPLVGVPLVP